MSDTAVKTVVPPIGDGPAEVSNVSVAKIFLEFLVIGATSFGGGVVGYLRNGLVTKRRWVDDKEFVEMLSLSQTLPGLNATNMEMLVGDKLRGAWGATAAIIAVCLPGAVFMYVEAILYHMHGDRPLVTAMLKGVAAAAVGLILATTWQLGNKSLSHSYDLIFVAITVLGVNRLHRSVPRVLIAVGLLAILWYHPRKEAREGAGG